MRNNQLHELSDARRELAGVSSEQLLAMLRAELAPMQYYWPIVLGVLLMVLAFGIAVNPDFDDYLRSLL